MQIIDQIVTIAPKCVAAVLVVFLLVVAPVRGIKAWRTDPGVLDFRADLDEERAESSWFIRTRITAATPIAIWVIGIALLLDPSRTSAATQDSHTTD
jgi:hypothetical protein